MKQTWKKHKGKIIAVVLLLYVIVAVALTYPKSNETVEEANPKSEETVEEAPAAGRPLIMGKQEKDLEIKEIPDESVIEIMDTDYENFLTRNQLPSLERMDKKEAAELVDYFQVLERIERLGYKPDDFLTPELNYKLLYTDVYNTMAARDFSNYYEFDGNSIAELNQFIAEKENAYIKIVSKEIAWDETLMPPSNITINADGVSFYFTKELDKAIYLLDVENVSIENFEYSDNMYNWGVFVVRGNKISIRNCKVQNARYRGMVVLCENNYLEISGCTVENAGNGGIMLNGDIEKGIIENNKVIDTHGTNNFSAGLLLTSIEIEDDTTGYNPFNEDPLKDKLEAPHNMVIMNNYIYHGNAGGIYSDGSYCNYILNNTMYLNDKEGICLDNGTFGCYVNGNTMRQNGGRRRQTQEDLENDFVGSFGTLSDGSSPAKLPGVSLDNAAYNIVNSNYVYDNYGSGIKMVRSCIRNIIMDNVVTSNNRGQSENFHFFGIELGYAAKPDYESPTIDFAACYENIVCRNMITGEHYAGIFMAEECYINDFYDNVIMNSIFWSMESLTTRFNATSNNIADISSRGIDLSNANNGNIVLPGMAE